MVNSSRSRKQLQKGVILKKWNGDPLIRAKDSLIRAKEGEGNDDESSDITSSGKAPRAVTASCQLSLSSLGAEGQQQQQQPQKIKSPQEQPKETKSAFPNQPENEEINYRPQGNNMEVNNLDQSDRSTQSTMKATSDTSEPDEVGGGNNGIIRRQ